MSEVLGRTSEETHVLSFSEVDVTVVVYTNGDVDINVGDHSFDGDAFQSIVEFVELHGQITVSRSDD